MQAGEVASERDGVVFNTLQEPSGVIKPLMAAIESFGDVRVIDFGGALGSTYRQCKAKIDTSKLNEWAVVEQPSFVKTGNTECGDGTLRFYESIESIPRGPSEIALLSGVLQYLTEPVEVLQALRDRGVRVILVDRTPTQNSNRDYFAVQHVPKYIYGEAVTYPIRLFSRGKLLEDLGGLFGGVVVGRSSFDCDFKLGTHLITYCSIVSRQLIDLRD